MDTAQQLQQLKNEIAELRYLLTRKSGLGSADIKGRIVATSTVSGATVADGSITTAKLASGAVTTAKLASQAVTSGKILIFISTEQTGTGAAQNIAHGLGSTPSVVLIAPTDTSPATVGQYTVTEGTHTSTNVVVTVTLNKKFKVLAIA